MGIQINGQTDTVTATDGSINVGGDVTIPGVLTYEDVTNIDSVGLITARDGIVVTGGSVGIGTDNPQDTLDVASAVPQIRLTDLSDGSYGQVRANGGNLILRADEGNTVADSVILAEIDGDEKLRITSAGNVGINSTIPRSKLHVASGTSGYNTGNPTGLGAGAIASIESNGTVGLQFYLVIHIIIIFIWRYE